MGAHAEGPERPWGRYEVLVDADDHKVKRIYVRPGKRLSLQRHRRRDETWVVVSGRGTAEVGDETLDLAAGTLVSIPRATAHRVGSDGPEELVFVEVQTGDYFGEDDIERLEDDFGRV